MKLALTWMEEGTFTLRCGDVGGRVSQTEERAWGMLEAKRNWTCVGK